MLSPRVTNMIFTDRKARRVRTTALFFIDDFALVEGWRRRSRRVAIDVTRGVQESEVLEVDE
jgi:hypothetical protein